MGTHPIFESDFDCLTDFVNSTMLNLLLRRSIALKRCKAEYVLAKVVDGKLVEAEFERTDKQFCFNPKITASVKVGGKAGMCTVHGIYQVLEADVVGTVGGVQFPKSQDWYGFMNEEGKDYTRNEDGSFPKALIFNLNRGTSENILRHDENGDQIWKDKTNKFTFDKCAWLDDSEKVLALNITSLPKED